MLTFNFPRTTSPSFFFPAAFRGTQAIGREREVGSFLLLPGQDVWRRAQKEDGCCSGLHQRGTLVFCGFQCPTVQHVDTLPTI